MTPSSETKVRRVQRERTRGWKMPENTVYVGRPSKWGNPWKPEQYWDAGFSGSAEVAIKYCIEAYKAWLLGQKHWAHGQLAPIPNVAELRGKNLACWCALDQPCHADVLLELAARPSET
jgi:hypothetical protein